MEAYRNLMTQLNNSVEEVRKSIYDTEIVNPIMFNGGIYRIKNKHYGQSPKKTFFEDAKLANFVNTINQLELENKKQMADFWLPPTALVDFQRSKNIVKTRTLDGGTIKEVYGFDDWQIQIRMTCIREKHRTAQETLDLLIEWSEVAESIDVTSNIFLSKNIHCIAIESIDINPIAGSPNAIPVVLNCVSDPSKESSLAYQKISTNKVFSEDKKLSDFINTINGTEIPL